MNNIQSSQSIRERNPWLSIVIILFYCLLGFFFIGPMIGALAVLPFFNFDFTALEAAMANPMSDPANRVPIMIIQLCASVVGFILIPFGYLYWWERSSLEDLKRSFQMDQIPVLITSALIVIFMFFNAFFIDWNANLTFPDFLQDFERWARQKEEVAAEVTTYITQFQGLGDFLLALLVIAIIPAIGEELVFRGMIQNRLQQASGNPHIAIWVAAILFSAIHFQFFGFVPRVLLGALFGYLYWWSGSLGLAILAHFVNNGFTLLMLYLYQKDLTTFDIESTERVDPMAALAAGGLCAGLMLLFYRYFHRNKAHG